MYLGSLTLGYVDKLIEKDCILSVQTNVFLYITTYKIKLGENSIFVSL